MDSFAPRTTFLFINYLVYILFTEIHKITGNKVILRHSEIKSKSHHYFIIISPSNIRLVITTGIRSENIYIKLTKIEDKFI